LPFVESLQQRVEAQVITQLVELRIGSDAINNQRIMPIEGGGQPINGFVGLAERGVYRGQMIGDASVFTCFSANCSEGFSEGCLRCQANKAASNASTASAARPIARLCNFPAATETDESRFLSESASLAHETAHPFGVIREPSGQQLERDLAMQSFVFGQIYIAHPAPAQERNNPVIRHFPSYNLRRGRGDLARHHRT